MERKDLKQEIEITEGIQGVIEGKEIILKKGGDELRRKLSSVIDTKIEGDKIILGVKNARKNEKKMFGTMKAHIQNMITGLNKKFKYKLQIANVHFPMTVKIDEAKNELLINNFLGEKIDRRIKLVPGVSVKVDKEFIEVEGIDREKTGQCAANIEKGAKPKNKDRRIFQDGIYIIEKPGRKFL